MTLVLRMQLSNPQDQRQGRPTGVCGKHAPSTAAWPSQLGGCGLPGGLEAATGLLWHQEGCCTSPADQASWARVCWVWAGQRGARRAGRTGRGVRSQALSSRGRTAASRGPGTLSPDPTLRSPRALPTPRELPGRPVAAFPCCPASAWGKERGSLHLQGQGLPGPRRAGLGAPAWFLLREAWQLLSRMTPQGDFKLWAPSPLLEALWIPVSQCWLSPPD